MAESERNVPEVKLGKNTRISTDGKIERRCWKCTTYKSIEEFARSQNHGGRGYRCQPCTTKYSFENRLKRIYGITLEQYEAMFTEQEGKCAICRRFFNTEQKKYTVMLPCVDHCHTTGKIRGLLCNGCNKAIGLLGDNVDTLNRAISYLLK